MQAILQAHENELGDFVLHMDGLANDFLLTLAAGGGATGEREFYTDECHGMSQEKVSGMTARLR
ncbi:hypothetical protein DMI66_00855 [Escherichia coli]|nr:hypothetical protein [Escherichia coli]